MDLQKGQFTDLECGSPQALPVPVPHAKHRAVLVWVNPGKLWRRWQVRG